MFRTSSLFDDMSRMFRSFDQLFRGDLDSDVYDLPATAGRLATRPAFGAAGYPPVEVRRDGKSLVFRAELPGVHPDDLQVNVGDGHLTVRGEKKSETENDHDNVVYREFWRGSFERSFALPEGIDADKIQARFENGVLTVVVPDVPALEGPRSVPIQIAEGSSTPKLAKKSA